MKKLLGALLCVAATSPAFAVNSVSGSNTFSCPDRNPASITTEYTFAYASANSLTYSVALDQFPEYGGAIVFLVYNSDNGLMGEKVLEPNVGPFTGTATLFDGQQMTLGNTYTIRIRTAVNASMYEGLVNEGHIVLAEAKLTIEGFKMSLGEPYDVEKTSAKVDYKIEYVGGTAPEGYTFEAYIGYDGKDSEKVKGQEGTISLTGLSPNSTYNLYQKYDIYNAEGNLDNSLRFTNDTHTATVKTLLDQTYQFDWRTNASYDATAKVLKITYEFVRLGEDSTIPEGAEYWSKLGTDYNKGIEPGVGADNDKIMYTQTGVYTFNNVDNGAVLTFWPNSPWVKVNGVEYKASVNGNADGGATFQVNVNDVQSGVAAVAVENGEVVYYNMQGVRVMNPEKGMYIVVKNGKAQKVAL